MDLINNSTIDTVIDFANAKFGMELTKDQVSEQLRKIMKRDAKLYLVNHYNIPYLTTRFMS